MRLAVFLACLCLTTASVRAADTVAPLNTSERDSFALSLAHPSGKAHELVYNEDGSKASELVWDMDNALALNAAMTFLISR